MRSQVLRGLGLLAAPPPPPEHDTHSCTLIGPSKVTEQPSLLSLTLIWDKLSPLVLRVGDSTA